MSAIVFEPPSTRLEIGQDMNASLGSINVTSIVPSDHRRKYLAAVAPP